MERWLTFVFVICLNSTAVWARTYSTSNELNFEKTETKVTFTWGENRFVLSRNQDPDLFDRIYLSPTAYFLRDIEPNLDTPEMKKFLKKHKGHDINLLDAQKAIPTSSPKKIKNSAEDV